MGITIGKNIFFMSVVFKFLEKIKQDLISIGITDLFNLYYPKG